MAPAGTDTKGGINASFVYDYCGGIRYLNAWVCRSPQQPALPTLAMPAPVAPPPYGPPITIAQAKMVVAAAVAEAKKTPFLYTFSVVDPSGDLVYFEKMDSAPTSSNEIGIGKARTAATFKRPSKAFFDQMESGHPYVGQLIRAWSLRPAAFRSSSMVRSSAQSASAVVPMADGCRGGAGWSRYFALSRYDWISCSGGANPTKAINKAAFFSALAQRRRRS